MKLKKVKLGDYCEIIKGNIGIKKAVEGEFPLVVTAEERLTHNEYQFDTKAVIIPLVSSTGHGHASLKRVHYQEGKFAVGTILAAVIVKDETVLNTKYLYLYLSYFKDQLLVPLMKGSANVTLSIKKIQTVEIPLPSIERQLEIIDLEKNNFAVEQLNFEIESQKQLLSQLKQAILQEAIQGKLTADWRAANPVSSPMGGSAVGDGGASELLKRIKAEKAKLIKEGKIKKEKTLPPITADEIPFDLPEGWVWCRVGDATTSIVPNRDKPKTFTGNIPWITQTNFDDGIFKLNYKEPFIGLSEVEVKKYNARIMPKNSVVMSCVGVFDIVVVPDKDIVANQQLHCFTLYNKTEPLYLAYTIRVLSKLMIKKAIHTTIKYLNKTKCESILLPLPPLEEQKAIVEKVEALMQKCEALEAEIKSSEAHAQMLMQAVLKEAFAGKQTVVEV